MKGASGRSIAVAVASAKIQAVGQTMSKVDTLLFAMKITAVVPYLAVYPSITQDDLTRMIERNCMQHVQKLAERSQLS